MIFLVTPTKLVREPELDGVICKPAYCKARAGQFTGGLFTGFSFLLIVIDLFFMWPYVNQLWTCLIFLLTSGEEVLVCIPFLPSPMSLEK